MSFSLYSTLVSKRSLVDRAYNDYVGKRMLRFGRSKMKFTDVVKDTRVFMMNEVYADGARWGQSLKGLAEMQITHMNMKILCSFNLNISIFKSFHLHSFK